MKSVPVVGIRGWKRHARGILNIEVCLVCNVIKLEVEGRYPDIPQHRDCSDHRPRY